MMPTPYTPTTGTSPNLIRFSILFSQIKLSGPVISVPFPKPTFKSVDYCTLIYAFFTFGLKLSKSTSNLYPTVGMEVSNE